ncbi:MAG TPA: hypothetical protein VGS19_07855 [Streptosporangiaceae bacterium]|nr:hypothetical protein [Streptosporangiaceae bacterium]
MKITVDAAMRARDVSRPRPDQEAAAESVARGSGGTAHPAPPRRPVTQDAPERPSGPVRQERQPKPPGARRATEQAAGRRTPTEPDQGSAVQRGAPDKTYGAAPPTAGSQPVREVTATPDTGVTTRRRIRRRLPHGEGQGGPEPGQPGRVPPGR